MMNTVCDYSSFFILVMALSPVNVEGMTRLERGRNAVFREHM